MIQHPVSSVNEEHAETERDIKMIVMRADDQHARTKACECGARKLRHREAILDGSHRDVMTDEARIRTVITRRRNLHYKRGRCETVLSASERVHAV